MSNVVQLKHQLKDTPSIPPVPGVLVRSYEDEADIARLLAIRQQAFAREKVGVRNWSLRDFEQEFFSKSWWAPDRCWLAFAGDAPIGTVTLALRGSGPTAVPVVHWLAVIPAWRRRGVGRLLVATLERAAWQAGHREVYLETHAQWINAGALYAALGYEPAGG